MESFFNAIFQHFNAEVEGHTALYDDLAPDDAVFPYAVFSIIPGAPMDTLSQHEKIETGVVQFNIYSKSDTPKEILDIKADVEAAFDYTEELETDDYAPIGFQRIPGIITKEVIKGKHIRVVMIQYEFKIGRKN